MEKLKVTNKYSYLNENFKPFSALSEDTFSVTKDGLEDLKDFIDDDITDETVDIIDAEASTEDELQDSYIGKVILDCNVCHSKLYKDIEDIHVDEESNSVNIDEECPYCYSTDGYKVVGKVVPYGEDCCEETCDHKIKDNIDLNESYDVTYSILVSDIVDAVKERIDDAKDRDDSYDISDIVFEEIDNRLIYTAAQWAVIEEFLDPGELIGREDVIEGLYNSIYSELGDYGMDESLSSKVDDSNKNINKLLKKESLDSDLAKYQKWVDYDMKRYGRISDNTQNYLKRAGLEVVKDNYGDYEVTDHSPITEDLDEIEIKGNGQKIKVKDGEITIKTCDKDTEEVELKDTEEVIAPLDDEEIAEIDDFDEEDFEELSERYLTEVYNNVNSFKLSKASLNKEGKLKLEGIVTFKSGNKRKTAFLFEKKNSLKSGKIKYIGENLDFSNGRKSFILNCSVNNKKLISESLTYNYTVKDNDGQSKRLYGTVRRNK